MVDASIRLLPVSVGLPVGFDDLREEASRGMRDDEQHIAEQKA